MPRSLQERRDALYAVLPYEVAELVRCARRYADRMDDMQFDEAEAELAVLRDQADDLRKWEDRQLRVQDACVDPPSPPKPRRKRSGRHLRVVVP